MESRVIARAGGWAALVAGLFGATAAAFLIFVPPAVPETVFSYPLTAAGHLAIQIVFGVHHLVAGFALWAFWRSGLAGPGRFAAVSGIASAAVFALFGIWEVVVGAFGNETYPSPMTEAIDGVYGTLSLSTAVSLVVFGTAAARARVLGPVSRWLVFAFGAFLIVPGLPLLFLDFVLGRVVIAVWLLILAMVGWSMLRWASRPASRSSTPHEYRIEP